MRILWLVEALLAFQELLCSIELVMVGGIYEITED